MNIAVIGAGLMGHGVAQEFAVAGHQVALNDLTETLLESAVQRMRSNLQMMSQFGLVEEAQIEAAPSRVRTSVNLAAALEGAEIVIEAITENLPRKQTLFQEMDRLCPPTTILASNTSTFMPSRLAEGTTRPERILIAHYFNPPHLVPGVEVVRHSGTSDEAVQRVIALLNSIGKKTVLLQREAPGFVANRLQAALLREACHIVQEGIASPQDVDTIICNGFGRRLSAGGVFEISEQAGLDLWSVIAAQLFPEISASPEVPAILQKQVERGEVGVKSGRGFYEWDADSVQAMRQRLGRALMEIMRWEK